MLPLDLFLYLGLLLSGFLYGIFHYSNLLAPSKLLTQLLGFIFLAEIISVLLAYTISYNLVVSYFLALIQLIYYYLIHKVLFASKQFKNMLKIIFSLAFVAILLSTFFIYKFQGHPSSISALLALYVVVSSLLYFLQMLRYPNTQSIFQEFGFWFGAGNLIFFSFTFFIFATYQSFLVNEVQAQPIWTKIVVKGCNFILYASYLVAIFLDVQAIKKFNEPR